MKTSSLGFGVNHVRPHIPAVIESIREEEPIIEYDNTPAVSTTSRIFLRAGVAIASVVVCFDIVYLILT